MTTGVLLVNLGTPDSCSPKDVKKYLTEFLTDGRVITLPPFKRHLLVRGVIAPFRSKLSAKAYQAIWTDHGSPLLIYSERVKLALHEALGEGFQVELGMRYQQPSIASALEKFQDIDHLIIFPLFPQYASATTGSIYEKVMDCIKHWPIFPKLTFIPSFATHPDYINALATVASKYTFSDYDHIVMSFHGLPVKHPGSDLYAEQCRATAKALATKLNLENYTLSFQSRLGKEPWLEPATSDEIKKHNNILVFSPSFVSDCLETLYEIGIEYAEETKLDFVEGLNDHPVWVETLKKMILTL